MLESKILLPFCSPNSLFVGALTFTQEEFLMYTITIATRVTLNL